MVSLVNNPIRIGGKEMKLLKDTNGAISNTMIILAVLALAVIGMIFMGMTPSEEEDVDIPLEVKASAEVNDITLTFADLAGTILGTDANLTVWLTSPDEYPDISAVYTEIDDEGKLVGPYSVTDTAGAERAHPVEGVVTFSVTATQYVADSDVNTGTDFGVAVTDDRLAAGGYNPIVGNIKVNSRLNPDLDVVTTIVENLPGYLGAKIELAPIGVLEYYEDLTETAVTGYNMNLTIGDDPDAEDFTVYARIAVEDTEIRDIATYVDVVTGTALLELDDVEINVDGDKIAGTSMTEVSDLSSSDPLKDNAPSEIGELYVVEGAIFNMDRINDNNMVEIEVVLSEYSTRIIQANDTGSIIVTLVALSGHEDTAFEIGTFTFILEESIAAPGYVLA